MLQGRLINVRQILGMTRENLADLFGVTYQTIYNYETFKVYMNRAKSRRYADMIFEVTDRLGVPEVTRAINRELWEYANERE